MAKDDIGGVWRTIGGRRVFIKTGQSLSDAMKESGKFNKKKNLSEEEKSELINETMNKRQAIIEKLDKETEDLNEYDKYNLAVSKLEQSENMQPTERQYWASVRDKYVSNEKAREKSIEANKSAGQKTADLIKENNIKTFGDEIKEQKLTDRDAKDVLKMLNDEGSDFTFDDDVKIEDGKIKTNVGVFMPDERGYVNRELEIPVDKNETYDSLEEKMRDWQSRHSTPDSFEDEDFKISKKEATNYTADEQSILDRFGEDYGYDAGDNLKNLRGQIDYMRNPGDSIHRTAERLVEGGDFLIYNGDIKDWLSERNIKYNDDNFFDIYKKEMADKIEGLYNRNAINNSLRQKAFQKYLKEHPGSKISFNDFKDMRKQ